MKQDHRPWDTKKYRNGANSDQELVDVARAEALYRDARNMCSTTRGKGSDGSLNKIGGEVLHFPATEDGANTYVCIGAERVKDWQVGLWASWMSEELPPCITVNGVVMVKSFALPYVYDKHLQLHSAWECGGGTLFDARSGSVPLHWDIGDIVRAFEAGENTYFEGLNISAYQVNPLRPVNRPFFRGFTEVGGGVGVKAGQVIYVQRYVNENGDRTPDSPPLGPFNVPFRWNKGWQSTVRPIPSADLAGPTPDETGQPTGIGVQLSIRVNNVANMQSIEVLRISWDQNAGPDGEPQVKVCYREAVLPGEQSVRDIVDAGEEEDLIATDENSLKTYFIREANSVRYVAFRLVYGGVKLGRRAVEASYIGDDDDKLFPVTRSIGREGHADPFNACYYKRFFSGERHGVAAVYYDSAGGESYADVITPSIQAPSRRDTKAGDSLDWSTHPIHACDINNDVRPTYEVFDQEPGFAIGQSQRNQVVNIMEQGLRKIGQPIFPRGAATGSMPNPNEVFVAPDGGTYGQNNDGVYQDDGLNGGPYLKTSYTKPFRPTGPTDFKFGLDYNVNPAVRPEGTPTAPTSVPYDPKVMGVRQHSLGYALRGIEEAPEGMQGFSMVITRPAGRVVAQALGTWLLSNSTNFLDAENGQQARKDLFGMQLCFPDYNSGALNQEVWETLQSNPGRYRLQIQSPLGFVTRQFGSIMAQVPNTEGNLSAGFSCLADLLSVARVLWDTGQCNPGNTGGYQPDAVLPGNPANFTGFGAWRNNPPPGPWQGSNGNALMQILGCSEFVHDSGIRSLRVSMDQQVYLEGQTIQSDFSHPSVRAMHEPWYVVNIIEEGKEPDLEKGFISCNHYVPFISQVGTTNGLPDQQFRLVDERHEDVATRFDGDERYLWVETPDGLRRYLNIDSFWDQHPAIQQAIQDDGFWLTPLGVPIYGLFNFGYLDPEQRLGVVTLLQDGLPPEGCRVEVRYDNRIPVFFFGDRYTAPSIATIRDAEAWGNGIGQAAGGIGSAAPRWPEWSIFIFTASSQTLYLNGLPVPFANYEYNDRYMVPFGRGFGYDIGPSDRMVVNQLRHGKLVSTRQWKVLFDCEVIAPQFLSQFNPGSIDSLMYPAINYVPRPYNFQFGSSLAAAGVHTNYNQATNYPGEDQNDWRYGGIKSYPTVPSDYIVRPRVLYFPTPRFGFTEEEDQCASFVYSEKDSPLLQDTPGRKTFPVTNLHSIEGDTGGIQRLYSDSNQRLFGNTSRGTFIVMLESSIAYSADGADFSMYAQDQFVGMVRWISKEVGMPGDWWQSAAEGAPIIEAGTPADALAWSNGISVYMLVAGRVVDIAIGRHRAALREMMSDGGYRFLVGGYDRQRNIFFFGPRRSPQIVNDFIDGQLVPRDRSRLLVHNSASFPGKWEGSHTYAFDKYLDVDGRLYGFRNLETYRLDEGDYISNKLVRAWVEVPSSPYPGERMEWMRVKVESPRKPKRIEFLDETGVVVCALDEAFALSIGAPGWTYLKKVTQWEQMIPRRTIDRLSLQGNVASYRVIFEDEGEDKIVSSAVQAKPLK